MPRMPYHTALIVGAGAGISASLARRRAAEGMRVGLAARGPDKLGVLAGETGAELFAVDAADPTGVADLFAEFERRLGAPDIVVYNASGRLRGSILDLDPEAVRNAIAVQPSVDFWWPSKPRSGWCDRGRAPSCSPALPRA